MLKSKCLSFLHRRTNFLISWQRFGRCVLWFWLRVTGSTSWKGSSPVLRMEKCEGNYKHITTHSLTQIKKASLKGYGKCSSITGAQRYKDIIELWALSVHFGFKCTDINILNAAHFVLLIGLLHQVHTLKSEFGWVNICINMQALNEKQIWWSLVASAVINASA